MGIAELKWARVIYMSDKNKKKLLKRDPRLVSQESLNNTEALRTREGEVAEKLTMELLRWRIRLEEHYRKLSEKQENDRRRQYLVRCMDEKAQFENMPKGKYCLLPSENSYLSKGEVLERLVEISGCSKGWFGGTAFDGRKRPRSAEVEQLMQSLRPKNETEFLHMFGLAEDKKRPEDPEEKNIRKEVKDLCGKKWPGLSWSKVGPYLCLSSGTMDNVKVKEHLRQDTAFRFIIALGGVLERDELIKLYHEFGLHPIEGGEADGVAEASMQGHGEITKEMCRQPGIYELETACQQYWALLKTMLRHYDDYYNHKHNHKHKNKHKLYGLVFGTTKEEEIEPESTLVSLLIKEDKRWKK